MKDYDNRSFNYATRQYEYWRLTEAGDTICTILSQEKAREDEELNYQYQIEMNFIQEAEVRKDCPCGDCQE